MRWRFVLGFSSPRGRASSVTRWAYPAPYTTAVPPAHRPLRRRPDLATEYIQELRAMAIPIPGNVRQLLDAPNYVHLTTLRADGSPRNWVVWVGLEDDHILVYTSHAIWKAKDMRHDRRVALSVADTANPY